MSSFLSNSRPHDSCSLGELNWDSQDSNLDFDGDGCRDDKPEDDNDDNDAWKDQDEITCGTNPLDASSYPSDVDGDGICDSIDSFDNRSQDSELNQNEVTEERCMKHGELFCEFTEIIEPVSTPILWLSGILFSVYLYRKTTKNSERLDDGSKRFGKGDRRFEHIEREIDELEEQIEKL